MAARRRHNRRRKARGRFRGLYQILAVAVVVIAIVAACVVFFRVQHIRVEGNRQYSEEEIIQISGIQTGDYLALLDTARIQRQLRAELPYVERASIHRALPDTVVITIQESGVAAAVFCQGQWWLANSSGKLLESVTEEQARVHPVLVGVTLLAPAPGLSASVGQEDENRWSCALELLSALEDRGELSRLDSLDCSAAGLFTARYDGKYTLLLPTTIEYQGVTQEQFSYFFAQLTDQILPSIAEEGQDIVDFTLWESTGRIYARRTKT